MIFIEPQGGLANRLRVISSFYKLIIDKEIKVLWLKNNDLAANFMDLFLPIEKFTFQNELTFSLKFIKNTNQKTSFKKSLASILNFIFGIDFCINDELVKKYRNSNDFSYQKNLKKHNNIYYRGCEEVIETDFKDFQIFKPTLEIKKTIDLEYSKFGKNVVGFHIRRTDHKVAIEKSPNDLFFKKAEILINEGFQIFLSTDDKVLEKEIINKFGFDKILVQKKQSYARKDLEGMKEAVIDLFLLSKTNEIFGSYWSSFGTVASKIGNIKHSYLTNN